LFQRQDEIGVKTFTLEKPFNVYPNLTGAKLTIEFHINPEGADLELYNLTGQIVLSSRVPPERDLFEMDIGAVNKIRLSLSHQLCPPHPLSKYATFINPLKRFTRYRVSV